MQPLLLIKKRFMQCSHISTTISVIRQVLTVTELKQNWLWKELGNRLLKSEEKSGTSDTGIIRSDIRLTAFILGLGCACKLRSQELEKILKELPLSLRNTPYMPVWI